MAMPVLSLPVPAVVGQAMCGRSAAARPRASAGHAAPPMGALKYRKNAASGGSDGDEGGWAGDSDANFEDSRLHALAVSMTLPPMVLLQGYFQVSIKHLLKALSRLYYGSIKTLFWRYLRLY